MLSSTEMTLCAIRKELIRQSNVGSVLRHKRLLYLGATLES